jgi:hypothetical protein
MRALAFKVILRDKKVIKTVTTTKQQQARVRRTSALRYIYKKQKSESLKADNLPASTP